MTRAVNGFFSRGVGMFDCRRKKSSASAARWHSTTVGICDERRRAGNGCNGGGSSGRVEGRDGRIVRRRRADQEGSSPTDVVFVGAAVASHLFKPHAYHSAEGGDQWKSAQGFIHLSLFLLLPLRRSLLPQQPRVRIALFPPVTTLHSCRSFLQVSICDSQSQVRFEHSPL